MVMRENLFGFQGNTKAAFLKIIVTDPKYINKLRTTIESNNANYKGLWKGVDGGILTFDSIQYVLRFMIDTGVSVTELYAQAEWTDNGRSPACLGYQYCQANTT
jgi:DNA polymerase delta subunit 1